MADEKVELEPIPPAVAAPLEAMARDRAGLRPHYPHGAGYGYGYGTGDSNAKDGKVDWWIGSEKAADAHPTGLLEQFRADRIFRPFGAFWPVPSVSTLTLTGSDTPMAYANCTSHRSANPAATMFLAT